MNKKSAETVHRRIRKYERNSTSSSDTEKATNKKQRRGPPTPGNVEGGAVLFDCDGRILALDEGAASILRVPSAESAEQIRLPQSIVDVLQAGDPGNERSQRFRIDVQDQQYNCRIAVAHSRAGGFPDGITVLHLEKDFSIDDALIQIGSEYRLTIRELEALRGVLSGLSSKEVAEQMRISPNTVKAFLRLIMGKMGVRSRTEIVAKFFEPQYATATPGSWDEPRVRSAAAGMDVTPTLAE